MMEGSHPVDKRITGIMLVIFGMSFIGTAIALVFMYFIELFTEEPRCVEWGTYSFIDYEWVEWRKKKVLIVERICKKWEVGND